MEQKISHELIDVLAEMAGMGIYVSEFVRGEPTHGEVDRSEERRVGKEC